MQKLHEKRVLHDILGIKPQISKIPDAIDHPPPSSSSNTKNSQAVDSAWASTAPNDGSDYEDHRSSKQSSRHDDERGRYDIGRQPTKKRQRVERSRDARTSYITDEEESRDDRSEVELGGGEEKYHNGRSREDRLSRPMNGERGKKRGYWLAKADAIGGAANDT